MISPQTIKRLPLYLREIRSRLVMGAEYVSSAELARVLGIDPILARKDLAVTGIAGRARYGFPAVALRNAILKCLGWENPAEAVLCGVGALGKALLGYSGFGEHNLSIVMAFDVLPELTGGVIRGVPVRHISEMAAMVRKLNAKIGILTVPDSAARECADMLAGAGVRGIWNFTHAMLRLPDTVAVRSVDLASSLALLSREISLK